MLLLGWWRVHGLEPRGPLWRDGMMWVIDCAVQRLLIELKSSRATMWYLTRAACGSIQTQRLGITGDATIEHTSDWLDNHGKLKKTITKMIQGGLQIGGI
jgi:hypothetical protein